MEKGSSYKKKSIHLKIIRTREIRSGEVWTNSKKFEEVFIEEVSIKKGSPHEFA